MLFNKTSESEFTRKNSFAKDDTAVNFIGLCLSFLCLFKFWKSIKPIKSYFHFINSKMTIFISKMKTWIYKNCLVFMFFQVCYFFWFCLLKCFLFHYMGFDVKMLVRFKMQVVPFFCQIMTFFTLKSKLMKHILNRNNNFHEIICFKRWFFFHKTQVFVVV